MGNNFIGKNYTSINKNVDKFAVQKNHHVVVTGLLLTGLIILLGVFYGTIKKTTSYGISAQLTESCTQQGGILFPERCPQGYRLIPIDNDANSGIIPTIDDSGGGSTTDPGRTVPVQVCCIRDPETPPTDIVDGPNDATGAPSGSTTATGSVDPTRPGGGTGPEDCEKPKIISVEIICDPPCGAKKLTPTPIP